MSETAIEVTDAMVEAGFEAISMGRAMEPTDYKMMRAALTAALSALTQGACHCTLIQQDETCPIGYPSLLCDVCNGTGIIPASGGVKVKEIEWQNYVEPPFIRFASTPVGTYRVERSRVAGSGWWVYFNGNMGGEGHAIEADAEAAAQADYEQRILAALAPSDAEPSFASETSGEAALDIEATAEKIARHLSNYKNSGRLHEPTYRAAKAAALIALECTTDHAETIKRLVAEKRIAELEADLQRVRGALEPFVKYLKTFDDGGLEDRFPIVDIDGDFVCTVGDLRRAALKGTKL